jgi:hypothetical protein
MLALITMLMAAAQPAELPIDGTTLARLPRAGANLTAHGKSMACTGVLLSDLVAAAGLPAGEAVRGPALTTLILAEAADGYRVAFTLAELDPKLGNRGVLLVDRCDGAALPADDGPLRLVAPGEARAARSVRQLKRLRVIVLPAQ